MSRRGRITVFVSIGLLLVAIAAIEVASGLSQEEPAAAEVVLPSSVLVAPRATVASLRGKPSIVHFWASWCDPCIKEAREFPKLAEQLGGRANLVGVDFSDDHAGARAFVRRFGWTFPVLVDAAGTAGERDGVVGLPTTLILDRDGRIIKRLQGPQTAAGLLKQLP